MKFKTATWKYRLETWRWKFWGWVMDHYPQLYQWLGKQLPFDKLNERRKKFQMNQKLTYSVEEAAKRIGLGKNSVYALAKAQKIPAIRVGRRFVINAELFDTWFQEQCANRTVIEL